MTLKPGCGCLILVLAATNLMLVALSAYGLISGTMDAAPMSFIMVIIFASDAVICFLVGLAAVRSRRRTATASGDAGEEAEGYEADDTGEDEEG